MRGFKRENWRKAKVSKRLKSKKNKNGTGYQIIMNAMNSHVISKNAQRPIPEQDIALYHETQEALKTMEKASILMHAEYCPVVIGIECVEKNCKECQAFIDLAHGRIYER